jgi:hypothetical protein
MAMVMFREISLADLLMNKFNTFFSELCKDTPIKVAYKDESKFMKLLGTLLFFNEGFMNLFVTTIGNTVYYPSRQNIREHEAEAILILAHEYQHIKDNQRIGKIIYPLIYLLPQCLALLSLLSLLAFTNSYAWLFLAFLLFLLPIPSPGRKYIELRGYKMSLFVYNLYLKQNNFLSDERKERLINMCDSYNFQFTEGTYYFMWPFGVKDELKSFVSEVVGERINYSDTYINVSKAFKESQK